MGPVITVRDYLAALRENRLIGLKCRECGFVTAPPRLACRRCSSRDNEIMELSGKGKIATFTSVCIPPESRRGKTPYIVVLVEMEEGPWIMGNLSGVDPAAVTLEIIERKVRMNNLSLPQEDIPKDGAIAPLFELID